MRKIIIDLETFGNAYRDLLPWLDDINLTEMAKVFIDDINGLASIAKSMGLSSQKEDYTKMSSTLTYVCRNSGFDVTRKSMDCLKSAVASVLYAILEILHGHGTFADSYYSIDKCQFYGNHAIENLVIVLNVNRVDNYGQRINKLIGDIAYEILDAFADNTRSRRLNGRDRGHTPDWAKS